MQDDQNQNTPPVPLAQNRNPASKQPEKMPAQPQQQPNPVQQNQNVPSSTAQPVQAGTTTPQASEQAVSGDEEYKAQQQPAPAAMTQQTQSSFQPTDDKKKGGKRGLFCTCTCAFLAIILVAIIGVGAYAYFSDTEIPVVSDVIEKIESLFRDPVEEAKAVQDEIASTLVNTLLPLASKEDGLVSAFAQTSISEEYVASMLEDYEEIDSLRFEIDGSTNYSASSGTEGATTMLSGGNMDINLVGAYNGKEEDNEKMELAMELNIEDEGYAMEIVGEVKAIGNKTYMKIDTFPFLTSAFSTDTGSIKDQWIDVSVDDVDSATSLFETESSTADGNDNEVSNDDIAKLIEFITDESVIKNVELLPNENIEGEDCNCVKLSWNKDEMKEVFKTYAEIYEEEYNEAEVNESLEGFENLILESCLGKSSEKIHRFRIIMSGTEEGEPINIDINLKLWDYSADIQITEPENAKTFADIMKEVNPEYYDYAVQSEMMGIQIELEDYYINNGEYPDSLSELDLEETVFEGEEVQYKKTADSFKLWIILPSGEKYELPQTY